MGLLGRIGRPEHPQRRGTEFDALVVGLGNPGQEYAKTRHNVGAATVTNLAHQLGKKLKQSRDRALTTEISSNSKHFLLAIPTTYMNESGNAVAPLAKRFAITDPNKIIIVHDELDLEPGVVKIKVGGGLAGHNGLQSVAQHLKTQDFARVRIGIGKPPSKERGADHVLTKVSASEQQLLDQAMHVAAEAVQMIIENGLDAAMHKFNAR